MDRLARGWWRVGVAALMIGAAGVAGTALGHGAIPASVPIERIIENIARRLEADPNDAHAHYVLGRSHALVYETGNKSVLAWQEGSWRGLEPASNGWQSRRWDDGANDQPTEAELVNHLREAIEHLNRAIELDPHAAAYHLALASILEAGRDRALDCAAHPLQPGVDEAQTVDSDIEDMMKGAINDYLHGRSPEHDLNEARDLIRSTSPWKRGQPSPRDTMVRLLLQIAAGGGSTATKARELLLEDWDNQVTECYFMAMCLALPEEGRADSKPLWGSLEDYVAYEASRHYVRIVEARGARSDEHIRLPTARATMEAFRTLPMPGGITPVVFDRAPGRTLADMVDPDAAVAFDLDGLARGARWSWVRPETGILVWDPDRKGEITSGRQLFGNASWWLMFRNGYEALDALDNDRDGWLTGAEIRGIAVWFDRNQDGVSDEGEVTPIEDVGVMRVACRADSVDGGCLAASHGIELTNGTVLASVDWVSTPVLSNDGGTISRSAVDHLESRPARCVAELALPNLPH